MGAQGLNGNYPEITYTLMSQKVEWPVGLKPNAPENVLPTFSGQLGEIKVLNLNHIPMYEHEVSVTYVRASPP